MKPLPLSLLLAALAFTAPSLPGAESPAADKPAAKEQTDQPAAAKEALPALDFGDHSSQALTTKAWGALAAGNHAAVDGYVTKCVELYESKALEMQASLKEAAAAEKANEYWALNDVATCYFVRGQSKEARGDTKGAIADYKMVVEKLAFAQCWDEKGWFWKPADAAKGKVKELEFDAAE